MSISSAESEGNPRSDPWIVTYLLIGGTYLDATSVWLGPTSSAHWVTQLFCLRVLSEWGNWESPEN
jgi:hypothetical protein